MNPVVAPIAYILPCLKNFTIRTAPHGGLCITNLMGGGCGQQIGSEGKFCPRVSFFVRLLQFTVEISPELLRNLSRYSGFMVEFRCKVLLALLRGMS